MTGLRRGARWYLRLALALVLLADLAIVSGMLVTGAPGPRTLESAPGVLLALVGRPELVLPIAAVGLAALVRFALGPGRAGAGLAVLAVLGVLCEAKAAQSGGPERFLFAGGTVLTGWLAGLAFVRASRGDREAEEIAAEAGALGALAAMYVNAALQKLSRSGLGWADGDHLRMLVLAQRPFEDGPLGAVADLVVGSRELAFALAAFTELAQIAAIAYPFHPRARAVVGTMLLAFHAGVRVLTPISFPQSMALLVAFSYPWHRLLSRRGAGDDATELVVARRPWRGALALGAGAALLASLALTPPVRGLVASLSHADELPGARREGGAGPAAAAFDARAAAALGIDRPGARVGGCTLESVSTPAPGEIAARFACGEGAIQVEIVPTGSRPHPAPRSAAGRDLFYRSGATVPPRVRNALLGELARRLAAGPQAP